MPLYAHVQVCILTGERAALAEGNAVHTTPTSGWEAAFVVHRELLDLNPPLRVNGVSLALTGAQAPRSRNRSSSLSAVIFSAVIRDLSLSGEQLFPVKNCFAS